MKDILDSLCSIEEIETHYLCTFDLPGIKKENIRVDVQNNLLTIAGERKEENENNGSDRFFGTFERSFVLETPVNPENAEATYSDGVLRVVVPKIKAVKSKNILVGEGKPKSWEKLLESHKEPKKEVRPYANH